MPVMPSAARKPSKFPLLVGNEKQEAWGICPSYTHDHPPYAMKWRVSVNYYHIL